MRLCIPFAIEKIIYWPGLGADRPESAEKRGQAEAKLHRGPLAGEIRLADSEILLTSYIIHKINILSRSFWGDFGTICGLV